jgi:drug/metabolite transporter (DMT)-like permease
MKSFAILAVLGAAISPAFANVVSRQTKGKLPAVSVKGNAFFQATTVSTFVVLLTSQVVPLMQRTRC